MREWFVSVFGGEAAALAIIVAVIGLAGVLGGAATSYLVAKKTVYINAITTERMKWIGVLRTNIASLIGQLTVVRIYAANRSSVTPEKLTDAFKNMTEQAKTIELQLNRNAEIDQNILRVLRILYASTSRDKQAEIPALSDELLFHSQWLLKMEWERVKYEARGSVGKLFSSIKRLRLISNYRRQRSEEYPGASPA